MRAQLPTTIWLLVSIGCVGTAGALVPRVRNSSTLDRVPRVSMHEFKRLQATGAVLVVDVRDEASYRRGHIPGAIGVPVAGIRQYADEIRVKAVGRPIVTYCSCLFEHTSAMAAATLIQQGLRNSRALVGGYPEWVATGGPVERDLLDGLRRGLVREKLLKSLVRLDRDHAVHAVVAEAAEL